MPGSSRSPKRRALSSLAEGLLGIPWAARPSELEARFRLARRKPGAWHRVGKLWTLEPGIALTGELRFARGGGVDHLRLYGSAVHPEGARHLDSSWREVVAPAIESWLTALGCVIPGKGVAELIAGGEVSPVGPGGVLVYVVLQGEPPVFTIGFVPPAA